MSYFSDWYNGRQSGLSVYPDGRGSLYQPVKLKRAFYILADCFGYIQNKKAKKADKVHNVK